MASAPSGQFVSVAGAARKLNLTEQGVMTLAEKVKIRIFRGSLGAQITTADVEKLTKEAEKPENLEIVEKNRPADAGPAAPSGKFRVPGVQTAKDLSGKTAPVGKTPSGKSPTRPPMDNPPDGSPTVGDGDLNTGNLFETSDSLGDGELAGSSISDMVAEAEKGMGGQPDPGESAEFLGAVLNEIKQTKAAAAAPAPPPQEASEEVDPDPKSVVYRPKSSMFSSPMSSGAMEPEPAPDLISVGRTRQLFLDDAVTESMQNLTREWHQPTKHPANPVLVPDQPWERGGYSVLCGSVLHDAEAGAFKMWYHTQGKSGRAAGYATSRDGLRWDKPLLDVVPFAGQPTNLVMGHPQTKCYAEILGVVRAPDDPERAYRAAFVYIDQEAGERGISTATSPDGLHWTPDDKITLPGVAGIGHLIRDELTGKYVLYGRGTLDGRRVVQRVESSDFVEWSEPEMVLAADADDPPGTDIYSLSVMNYGRTYIGLAQIYHGPPDCLIDLQLCHSEDGKTWSRASRKPFLPLGAPGEWDRFNTSVGCGKTIRVAKKELWVYYGGRSFRHPQYQGNDQGVLWGAIGLAKLRVDGFCSLNASFAEGILITKPLLLKYPTLCVNAYNPFGEVRVSVLDENGRPLPGLMSRPFVGDKCEMPLTWPEGQSLAPHLKKPVRLRFAVRNAKLFSFWTQ